MDTRPPIGIRLVTRRCECCGAVSEREELSFGTRPAKERQAWFTDELQAIHHELMQWAREHGYDRPMSGYQFRRWFNRETGANLPDATVPLFLRTAVDAISKPPH